MEAEDRREDAKKTRDANDVGQVVCPEAVARESNEDTISWAVVDHGIISFPSAYPPACPYSRDLYVEHEFVA